MLSTVFIGCDPAAGSEVCLLHLAGQAVVAHVSLYGSVAYEAAAPVIIADIVDPCQ